MPRDTTARSIKYAWVSSRRTLRRGIGFDYSRTIVLERSLEQPIQVIEPKVKIRIEQAAESHLGGFRDIVDKKKYEVFQERFKKGLVCQAAFDGDKIVGFLWANLHEYEADCETRGRLNEREAYMFDGYVSLGYRQGGLAAAVSTHLFSYLRNRGYRTVFGTVDERNIPARKAWGRVGWQGRQIVTVLTMFGLKFRRWQKFTGIL